MKPIKLDIQRFASTTIYLSTYTGSYNVTFQGRLDVSSTAGSSTDNSSSVTVTLYARKQNSSSPTTGKSWSGNITIDGATSSFSSLSSSLSIGNSWVQVWSYTRTVGHNDDGSKTIYISGSIKGASGTSLANATSSGGENFTLDTIPRYANIISFSASAIDETSVRVSWNADASCDTVQYSLDNGAWTAPTGSTYPTFTISNLAAGSNHYLKIRVKRTDSQLWTESWQISVSTYPYPTVYGLPKFTIGEPVTLSVNNPLHRQFKIYFYFNENQYLERTITDSFSGWNESETIDILYNLLPNAQSGFYTIKTYYNGIYDFAGEQNTFSINVENSKPIFNNFEFEDVNATTLALTNDSSKIVDGYSTVQVTINGSNKATGYKGAAISKYNINGTNYDYNDNFTQTIENYTLGYINVSAIDSRSNEKIVQKSTTLLGYFKPTKNTFSYERSNQGVGSQVTFKFSGTFWNKNFGQVANSIKKATYKYKKTNASDYSSDIDINTDLININDNNYSFNHTLNGDSEDNGFDIGSSYNVVVTIYDELGSVDFNYVVIEGSPAIDLFGNCISLGGMYDENLGGRVQINNNGIVLYESTGSNSNITLEKDCSLFNYLEIFYRNNDNIYGFVKVDNPNGKSFIMQSSMPYSAGSSYLKYTCAVISNYTISPNIYSEIQIYANSTNVVNTNVHYITKVVGYL
jgi:hypothetical protein